MNIVLKKMKKKLPQVSCAALMSQESQSGLGGIRALRWQMGPCSCLFLHLYLSLPLLLKHRHTHFLSHTHTHQDHKNTMGIKALVYAHALQPASKSWALCSAHKRWRQVVGGLMWHRVARICTVGKLQAEFTFTYTFPLFPTVSHTLFEFLICIITGFNCDSSMCKGV